MGVRKYSRGKMRSLKGRAIGVKKRILKKSVVRVAGVGVATLLGVKQRNERETFHYLEQTRRQ
jgi:hypothetical protein